MNQLGDKHIAFMRQAAKDASHTHEPVGIDKEDLDLMVREGLLIEYRGPVYRYAITRAGISVASSFGDSPDLIELAVKFAMTKDLTEEEARAVVKQNGAVAVLKAKEVEERGDASGQREVKVPTDDMGNSTMNFKKSF